MEGETRLQGGGSSWDYIRCYSILECPEWPEHSMCRIYIYLLTYVNIDTYIHTYIHIDIYFFSGWFYKIFKYLTQHCFICRPSDSTVPEDAGIEPRTVATLALALTLYNLSARSHRDEIDIYIDKYVCLYVGIYVCMYVCRYVWRTCLNRENLRRQERENTRGEYEENAPILPMQFSQSCQSSLTI